MSDKSEKNGRRTSMGREDAKASNALLVGLGVGTVVAVTGLSVAGTVTAINAMNRQSEEAVAAAEAAVAQQKAEDAAGTAASETVPSSDAGVQDVIDWMSENGISFNEDGLPVDRDGNVVDNPFTDVDESLLAVPADEDTVVSDVDADADVSAGADAGTDTGSGSSGVSGGTSAPDVDTPAPAESSGSAEEPADGNTVEEPAVEEPAVEESAVATSAESEPAEAENPEPEGTSAWYYNDDGTLVDGIQLDASGNPYYVVVKGDWLSRIASRYGFDDYNELAELSGIADPNWIYPGDVIYFPSSSGTAGSGSVAPGLG